MKKLIIPTLRNFLMGVILLGILLFLPAGTLNYWQAWVFIAVFMVTLSVFGVYFSINDPELIQRRTQAGPGAEQSTLQKIVASVAIISMLAVFVVCGLDYRFGWSHMPPAVSWIGDGIEVFSFIMFYRVFKENSFGGSSIRVEQNQKVISTGPYAIVRHPMYVGTIVMVIGVALGLGSWWVLLFLIPQFFVLAIRILDEEKTLENELAGYKEYELKVHYRLVPYLW
jgi:protein-S-isoprenylcysteine O-methyltransferase Ste14